MHICGSVSYVRWHLPFYTIIYLNNTNYWTLEQQERDGEENEKRNRSMTTELFACLSCLHVHLRCNSFAYGLGGLVQIFRLPVNSISRPNCDINVSKAHFSYHVSFPYVLHWGAGIICMAAQTWITQTGNWWAPGNMQGSANSVQTYMHIQYVWLQGMMSYCWRVLPYSQETVTSSLQDTRRTAAFPLFSGVINPVSQHTVICPDKALIVRQWQQ